MIKNIMFDLDGTLLPVNQDEFVMKVMSVMEVELKKTDLDSTGFLKGMLKGIDTIVKNSDGSCTNEELFWRVFLEHSEIEQEKAIDFFVDFYNGAYVLATEIVAYNTIIADTVTLLKNKGYNMILATSPVFPALAVFERMKWNDIFPEDFSYISCFENSSYAKPKKEYYQEILDKLDLDPEETIMVGNDVLEDGIVEELGVDCYLITDFLVNRYNTELSTKWSGTFDEFYDLVENSF